MAINLHTSAMIIWQFIPSWREDSSKMCSEKSGLENNQISINVWILKERSLFWNWPGLEEILLEASRRIENTSNIELTTTGFISQDWVLSENFCSCSYSTLTNSPLPLPLIPTDMPFWWVWSMETLYAIFKGSLLNSRSEKYLRWP